MTIMFRNRLIMLSIHDITYNEDLYIYDVNIAFKSST